MFPFSTMMLVKCVQYDLGTELGADGTMVNQTPLLKFLMVCWAMRTTVLSYGWTLMYMTNVLGLSGWEKKTSGICYAKTSNQSFHMTI